MSASHVEATSVQDRLPALYHEGAAGIGIGHWRADTADEICAPAFDARVVCVHLRPTRMTVWSNDVERHDGYLPAGAWLSHAPGEEFRGLAPDGYEVMRLEIPDAAIGKALSGLDLGRAAAGVELRDAGPEANTFLLALAIEIRAAINDATLSSRLQADGIVSALLAHLLLRQSNLTCSRIARTAMRGGLAPWQQRRATEYLRTHLAYKVSLEQLAEQANLSTFHFARSFRTSMGMPPHAYLRRLRCDRARELLTSGDLSIGEIGAAVGYETNQAFARMFRAEVGASPSEYRRQRS